MGAVARETNPQKRDSSPGKLQQFHTERPQPFQLKSPRPTNSDTVPKGGDHLKQVSQLLLSNGTGSRAAKRRWQNVLAPLCCLSRVEGTKHAWVPLGKTAPLAEQTKGRTRLRAVRKGDSKHGTLWRGRRTTIGANTCLLVSCSFNTFLFRYTVVGVKPTSCTFG